MKTQNLSTLPKMMKTAAYTSKKKMNKKKRRNLLQILAALLTREDLKNLWSSATPHRHQTVVRLGVRRRVVWGLAAREACWPSERRRPKVGTESLPTNKRGDYDAELHMRRRMMEMMNS
jgi:hypothetical protein